MGLSLRVSPARRRAAPAPASRTAPRDRDEHPVEALQRTIGNRATTLLIQRRESATGPTALRPDATHDELHAEYLRGRELYGFGMFDEAIAVWMPVYGHPMTRGNTRLRVSLALIIGRAHQHAGRNTEAIGFYQEVVASPGATAEDVAQAQQFLVAARRGSEAEAGVTPGRPLPADASDDQLHAEYLEGLSLHYAGLYDAAAARLLPVYEHPNVGQHRRGGLAVLIGTTHFHAHRFDVAISWYQQAIESPATDADTIQAAKDRIARCRRGSTEQAGTAVGEAIDPDASSDDLYKRYLEGEALYRAGLFDRAIGAWVPVYEHPKVGDEKRGPIGLRIGTAHHHQNQYGPAISWYTEVLVRGGLPDIDAVVAHRRLVDARRGQPISPMVASKRPMIRQGWVGEHVRHLQKCLKEYGFDLKIDGIFGPKTAGQVKQFQAANGLTPDGVVGPKSWYVLS